jgi:MFS family permease
VIQAAPSLPLESTAVRLALGAVAVALIWVLGRELRKIPPKLGVLMATAFVDMVGLLMVLPLLPFYAKSLGGETGVDVGPWHLGIGVVVALLVSSFTVAQLVSAPMWGRFSDRHGRRPALMVALAASAAAYVVFAFADSLWLLFLSRLVQGAGGGTVGVIQAYVADVTEPHERAKALGWLSAATNLGVALGPVLGAVAVAVGDRPVRIGGGEAWCLGDAAPGLFAAALCLVNLAFCWRYLREVRQPGSGEHAAVAPKRSGEAVRRVVSHSGEPASRLIWIYAVTIGAFQGVNAILALFLAQRFGVTEATISYFFTYVGAISVFSRVLLLGRAVDAFGEARLSRYGMAMMGSGLALMPVSGSLGTLALAVALLPLGAAFTFPCVTALLSRVIPGNERGLYMGVQQTFGGASRVVFPILFGVMFDAVGYRWSYWLAATVVLASISLGMGLDAYAKPKPAPAPASR